MQFPLELVGIFQEPCQRPQGRIKRGQEVGFEDFQVLEFYSNGTPLDPIFETHLGTPAGDPSDFVWARLSKVNISTKGFQQRFSKLTGIPSGEIQVAGMKDSCAITSQLISLPARYLEEVRRSDFSKENFFLRDLTFASTPIHQGAHSGNFFRVTVWPHDGKVFSNDELRFVIEKTKKLASNGFPNFFFTQRFGTRPSAHLVGAKMVANDFKGAMDVLIGMQSDFEPDWAKEARQKAMKSQTRCEAIEALASANASYFGQELRILDRLERGFPLEEALLGESKPNFLVQAYFSWIWNQAISTYLRMGWDLPEKFPFIKGAPDKYRYDQAREHYLDVGIVLPDWPAHCYQEDSHIVWRPTITKPEGLKVSGNKSHLDFQFKLGVNAFATSLLSQMFNFGGDAEDADVTTTE